jgi:phosphatidylinositol alpha-mannosyltransferase
LRRLVTWGAARLDLRCAVSEEARATAFEALGGEYDLLFNGIEVERFAKASPAPTEGSTVLFVGRHEERKGLGVLLEAMRSLPGDLRLWVTGEGPQTAALRAAYKHDQRVEWLGRVSDDDKAALLRGADVFCAPSLHGESFGVVLLEAMAAGTPIVASDLDGYRLVARDGRDAHLVPPGDPQALARGIELLLSDGAEAARLAASGECRAAEFSMSGLAEQYLERYERIA